MPDKNLTSFVAWWGAIVATLVFLWDIYKWVKSGPSVTVSAQPNMRASNELLEGLYVAIEAINKGNKQTTITHLVAYQYSSLIKRLLKKKSKSFIVPNTGPGERLPHVLGPGERWLGIIQQNEELEKLARNGYLYCGIYHALHSHPIVQRVKLKENAP